MTAVAASPPTAQALGDRRAWIAVAAATLCAFTSFLDITVTNASLPQIQGGIGASGTEGTWIGTAYLAAEVVMIPLTAWFTRLLGLRLYLISAIIAFTFFSVICAIAADLPQMILGRAGQGFAGGALIPAGLVIIATRLTPAQRPAGLSVYATMTVLAPVVGPPVGGWLTENLSWHWIFYMNIPLGALLIAMVMMGLDREPLQKNELARADWLGIAGLAATLASLTVVLEEGQRQNWLESTEIVLLCLTMMSGMAMVAISQIRSANPVVKLRLLKNSSYAGVILCVLIVGGAPFAVVYLVPTFLAAIAGYDAQQTGLITAFSGVTSFLFMPLFAWMLSRVDIRYMVGGGMLLYAVSSFLDTGLTVETVGSGFILAQLIRGGSQMMATLPLSQAATAGLLPEDIADGAALFTVARNLGGSTSLALTGVMIDRRMDHHVEQLGMAHSSNSAVGQERIAEMTAGLVQYGGDDWYAQQQALRMISGELHRQALVMTYNDMFWVIGIALLLALPAVLLIRPRLGGGGAHAH